MSWEIQSVKIDGEEYICTKIATKDMVTGNGQHYVFYGNDWYLLTLKKWIK